MEHAKRTEPTNDSHTYRQQVRVVYMVLDGLSLIGRRSDPVVFVEKNGRWRKGMLRILKNLAGCAQNVATWDVGCELYI